jgi:hypothetical protein
MKLVRSRLLRTLGAGPALNDAAEVAFGSGISAATWIRSMMPVTRGQQPALTGRPGKDLER